MRLLAITALVLASLVASSVWAEEKVLFRKVTKIDFDSDLIDGNLASPENQVIDSTQHRHPKLINVRDSFRGEVLKSMPK